MNKKTVFTIVFAAAVVIAIAVTAYVLSKKEKEQQEQQTTGTTLAYDLIDEDYGDAASKTDVKLYSTHIDGLFYSLSPVQYYYAKGGKLSQLESAGTLSVKPVVADTKMDFEIEYVEFKGQTFGIAVWHSDEGVYNDVFALLADMPEAFHAPQAYMLLIDTAQRDIGADKRLYSELLAVSESGENIHYLFGQGNRMSEPSGKLRTDWDCATAAMLTAQEGGALTFTGKKYHHSDQAQEYDLQFTESGSTQVVQEGVCGAYAAKTDEGVFYTVQTKTGWELYQKAEGESKNLASYEGAFGKEFDIVGDFAFKRSDGTFVDLQTGNEFAQKTKFKKIYAGAAIGSKTVCIGKEENKEGKDYKVQKIVVTDTKKEKTSVYYANNIMDENSSLLICQEGIVTQREGKSEFISFKSLESMASDVVK